ncbi:hypothetical protein GRI69_08930 [Erythrobacter vulgaris]|uniref:Uncharacterized protein n=1 Tax=Qipengyuania vulgaris TaxID=291985 RepID=A0A844XSK6_9SPHN|nr:hypothetical protein [Qipengyuania vulgaris]MXO48379.1 hypothetical protein [Qipengyuania vulgaris]
MSLIFAAAATLVPVQIESVELSAEGTFVSEFARQAIAEKSVEAIQCLAIGERRDGTNRVCLTAPEWQRVFDRVARSQSAERRDRAIADAQFRASRPGY